MAGTAHVAVCPSALLLAAAVDGMHLSHRGGGDGSG
jgi:hypothetical protein